MKSVISTERPKSNNSSASAPATALTQIGDQVLNDAVEPSAYTEALLNALARLPVAKGEITAQKLKGTVADVQRSAKQRLNSLSRQIDSAKTEADALVSEIEARRAEFAQLVLSGCSRAAVMAPGRRNGRWG